MLDPSARAVRRPRYADDRIVEFRHHAQRPTVELSKKRSGVRERETLDARGGIERLRDHERRDAGGSHALVSVFAQADISIRVEMRREESVVVSQRAGIVHRVVLHKNGDGRTTTPGAARVSIHAVVLRVLHATMGPARPEPLLSLLAPSAEAQGVARFGYLNTYRCLRTLSTAQFGMQSRAADVNG